MKATITALDTESQHTESVLLFCRESGEGRGGGCSEPQMDLGPVSWAHNIPQQPSQVLGTANLNHFLPKTHTEILKKVIISGNCLPQSLGS